MLGISFDSPEENAKFAEKYDFPFPLLSDEDREIGLAYGACEHREARGAKRIAYLIDEEGRVVEAHAKVDAANYPKEQLERL